LKDDAKQNKDKSNNNIEHKQNTIEGVGEVFTYGCVSLIVVNRKENLPSQTPNNALIFFFNVHNNIQKSHKQPL